MNFKAIFKTAFVLLLFAALALGLLSYARKYPENLPWTKLDLTRPIGTFPGRKLAGLTHDAPRCQALLDVVCVAYRSEEHTSELQQLIRFSYPAICWNQNTISLTNRS